MKMRALLKRAVAMGVGEGALAGAEEKGEVVVGSYPIVTLEKAGTEYDRKPGIKWLSCTEK
jgi:hypothetical protein